VQQPGRGFYAVTLEPCPGFDDVVLGATDIGLRLVDRNRHAAPGIRLDNRPAGTGIKRARLDR
jgi:hypothetical protein